MTWILRFQIFLGKLLVFHRKLFIEQLLLMEKKKPDAGNVDEVEGTHHVFMVYLSHSSCIARDNCDVAS